MKRTTVGRAAIQLLLLAAMLISFQAPLAAQQATPVVEPVTTPVTTEESTPAPSPQTDVQAMAAPAPATTSTYIGMRWCIGNEYAGQTFWHKESINNVEDFAVPNSDGTTGGSRTCFLNNAWAGQVVRISLYNADTDTLVTEVDFGSSTAITIPGGLPAGSYYATENINNTRTNTFTVQYEAQPIPDPIDGYDPNAFDGIWGYNIFAEIYTAQPKPNNPGQQGDQENGRILWNWALCVSEDPSSHQSAVFTVRDDNVYARAMADGQPGEQLCNIATQVTDVGALGAVWFDRLDDNGNVVESFGPLTGLTGTSGGWTWDEYNNGNLPYGTYQARFVWNSGVENVSDPFPVHGFDQGSGATNFWPPLVQIKLFQLPVPVAPVLPVLADGVCVNGTQSNYTVTFPVTDGVTYVTSSDSVAPGESVTITATLQPGYGWESVPAIWTVTGDSATTVLTTDVLDCTIPSPTPTMGDEMDTPTPEPTETSTVTPSETPTVGATETPSGTSMANPTEASATSTATTAVTSLPSTGDGQTSLTNTVVLMGMAGVLLIGLCGAVYRTRR